MSSLENLNLPEESNLSEKQGNAQLSVETSVKNEVENIEQTTEQEVVDDVESKNIEQLEEEPKMQLSDNLGDDKDSENLGGLELMPENEEDSESEDENDEDETFDDSDETVFVDYSVLTKLELLEILKEIVYEREIETVKRDIDAIKKAYYRGRQSEIIQIKAEFLEKGGLEEAFEVPRDEDEDYFKELLNDYKIKKAEFNERLEAQKFANLDRKKEIIEKIGLLANRDESLSKTWEDFRDLQNQWKEIGQVPATERQDILNQFQMEVEKFYVFIKIDKELRDLDLKKNLEFKLELCNKAESLLTEPDIVAAYKKLQDYHEEWKEIGPVPNDKREEIWERFQVTTKQINKNHQDHFLKIKDEYESNLRQKEVLCEQAENLLQEPCETVKQWEAITQKFSELQQMWRSIGMVPKKFNAEIYDRFRNANNKFFEEKKKFFAVIRDEQNDNLHKKIELCVMAESLQESTDWRKTTGEFLDIQKQWKKIGSVPRKQSQEVWLRFRKACDHFFNAKQTFFENIETEHSNNLKLKTELIEEVKQFKGTDNIEENLEKLKDFQNKWTQIGQVAFKEKDRIYKEFRASISALYERLNIKKDALDIEGFKHKVKAFSETGDTKALRIEKSAINQKIKNIENDISLWETNMSFFSGKAEGLLADAKKKIEKAKAEIETLLSQRKAIDIAERELSKKDKEN